MVVHDRRLHVALHKRSVHGRHAHASGNGEHERHEQQRGADGQAEPRGNLGKQPHEDDEADGATEVRGHVVEHDGERIVHAHGLHHAGDTENGTDEHDDRPVDTPHGAAEVEAANARKHRNESDANCGEGNGDTGKGIRNPQDKGSEEQDAGLDLILAELAAFLELLLDSLTTTLDGELLGLQEELVGSEQNRRDDDGVRENREEPSKPANAQTSVFQAAKQNEIVRGAGK